MYSLVKMLKFTSIVGYTSCGPSYIESFLTIFGQCINVLNYKCCYASVYGYDYVASGNLACVQPPPRKIRRGGGGCTQASGTRLKKYWLSFSFKTNNFYLRKAFKFYKLILIIFYNYKRNGFAQCLSKTLLIIHP